MEKDSEQLIEETEGKLRELRHEHIRARTSRRLNYATIALGPIGFWGVHLRHLIKAGSMTDLVGWGWFLLGVATLCGFAVWLADMVHWNNVNRLAALEQGLAHTRRIPKLN